jgi:hypothetical protein
MPLPSAVFSLVVFVVLEKARGEVVQVPPPSLHFMCGARCLVVGVPNSQLHRAFVPALYVNVATLRSPISNPQQLQA